MVAMSNKKLQFQAPFHVAIVGTGASGTLVAAQFKRIAPQGKLALIGNAPHPARGVAYETRYLSNFLNVAAGNMSAFPDDMNHFVNWLKKHLPKTNADSFVPRLLYGDYLADIFSDTVNNTKDVEYISGAATGLSRQDDLWAIRLENGDLLEAYSVVLAFGNLLTPSDPIDFSAVKSNYWRNPWDPDVALGLDSDAPVFNRHGTHYGGRRALVARDGSSRTHPCHLASRTFISIS